MKNSGSAKKPTGKVGPIIVDPEKKTAEFQPLKFPKGKAEIERFIVELLLKVLRKRDENFYQLVSEPVQNSERDFDFTFPTSSDTEHLDLMEIAPLENVKGSFEDASFSYNHGEMADWIWAKLISKSNKYATPTSPLHLLLYSTDWRFRLSENVINLLAYWSLKQEHCFKTILYFVPDDKTHGEVRVIYPVPEDAFVKFDERAARNRKSLIGNPLEIQTETDGSFSIPLGTKKSK